MGIGGCTAHAGEMLNAGAYTALLQGFDHGSGHLRHQNRITAEGTAADLRIAVVADHIAHGSKVQIKARRQKILRHFGADLADPRIVLLCAVLPHGAIVLRYDSCQTGHVPAFFIHADEQRDLGIGLRLRGQLCDLVCAADVPGEVYQTAYRVLL